MTKEDYLGHRTRMREKILKCSDSLHDYELLELLLFNVFPRRDVKPIAKNMIRECKQISNVFFSDYFKLKSIDGVSDSTIAMIFTIRKIMQMILNEDLADQETLAELNDTHTEIRLEDNFKIINYLKMAIGNNETESLCILYLNIGMKLIKADIEDHGTIDKIAIYHREIIKRALDLNATAIVLSHNHPSGNPEPSKADINSTEQLRSVCSNIGVKLLDHIIITKRSHYSFFKNGLL